MSIISDALKKAQKEPQKYKSEVLKLQDKRPPFKKMMLAVLIIPLSAAIGIGLAFRYRNKANVLPETSLGRLIEKDAVVVKEVPSIKKVPEVVPEPVKPAVKKPKVIKTPRFSLNGIILGEGVPLAIINHQILKEGDRINGAHLIHIYEDRVVLKFRYRVIELKLE